MKGMLQCMQHTRMVSEWKKNSVYEQIPTAALPASGS